MYLNKNANRVVSVLLFAMFQCSLDEVALQRIWRDRDKPTNS